MRGVKINGVPHDFVGPLPGEIVVRSPMGISSPVELWVQRYDPEQARVGSQMQSSSCLEIGLMANILGGRMMPIYLRFVNGTDLGDVGTVLSRLFGDSDLADLVIGECFSRGSMLVTLPFAEYWRPGGVLDHMAQFCGPAQTEGPVPREAVSAYREELDLLARGCRDNLSGRRLRQRMAQITACRKAFERFYANRR